MNGMRKSLGVLLAILMLCMPLALVAGCDGKGEDKPGPTGDYEFVFEGGGVFDDGVNYHVTVYGNKDESLSLHVAEMPTLSMSGHWVFVENKGYKLYFNDAQESFAYARYDTATEEFTVKYSLNLGGGQGNAKVTLTCKDEAFAAEYDGIGLPPLPPTFTGHGWNGTNRHDCILYCYEDGTCKSVTNKAGVPDRMGTYTYDEETNVYSFEFEDEKDHYPANYIGTAADGSTYYRLDYCVFRGDDPSKGNFRGQIPTSEGFPQFTTSAYWIDENGEKVWYDFKTTYDEETKTYTLYYEAYSKGLQNRVVTYTVDE